MTKFLTLCTAAIIIASSVSPMVSAAAYIGNVNSMIFHYEDCRFGGKRIKEVNRIYFDTRDEAISSGYRPCKVCNP